MMVMVAWATYFLLISATTTISAFQIHSNYRSNNFRIGRQLNTVVVASHRYNHHDDSGIYKYQPDGVLEDKRGDDTTISNKTSRAASMTTITTFALLLGTPTSTLAADGGSTAGPIGSAILAWLHL